MKCFPKNPLPRKGGGSPILTAGSWRGPTFGPDSGDVRDVARRTGSATRTAGVGWTTGPLGACLDFGGSGYVPFPLAGAPGTYDFTLGAAFAGTATGLQCVLSVGDSASGNGTFGLCTNGGQVYITSWAAGLPGGVGPMLNDGRVHWAFVAFHAGPGTIDVFVDNQTIARNYPFVLSLTGTLITLGALFTSFNYTGQIPYASVWDRALEPAEIAREADPFKRRRRARIESYGPAVAASGRARRVTQEGGFASLTGGFAG